MKKGLNVLPHFGGLCLEEEMRCVDCLNGDAGTKAANFAGASRADEAVSRRGEAEDGDRTALECVRHVDPSDLAHAMGKHARMNLADGMARLPHEGGRGAEAGKKGTDRDAGNGTAEPDDRGGEIAKEPGNGRAGEADAEDDRVDFVWIFDGILDGERTGERFGKEDDPGLGFKLRFESAEKLGIGAAFMGGMLNNAR